MTRAAWGDGRGAEGAAKKRPEETEAEQEERQTLLRQIVQSPEMQRLVELIRFGEVTFKIADATVTDGAIKESVRFRRN